MSAKTMRRSFLVMILLSVLNPVFIFAKEPYWEERGIELSGLTEGQLRSLEATIHQLKTLEPGKLKMDKKVYRRLSRFSEMFGFPFHGRELADWILARIRRISYHDSSTAALNQNRGSFVVGEIFFTKINPLERLYLLIHEARHSDGDGHDHIKCPKDFKFVSAAQPDFDLEREASCDSGRDGAYAFQAAFLFELYAYGLIDQKEAGLLYNSSISRVIP